MGWLFMQSLDAHRGPKQYLDAQCTYERDTHVSKVLRSALVKMRVYYAAVETVFPDGKRDVWAAVCPVKYNPRDRDGFIFGYKSQSEDAGPCETECPKAILDLLTPTESVNANEWRERCRKFLKLRQQNAKKPKLQPGQIIEFDSPIYMTDKTSHKTLEVVTPWPRSRSILFRAPDTGLTYNIRNVRSRNYKVINRSA
jgi:hypothetical protein